MPGSKRTIANSSVEGYIYIITNKSNDKVYIGQTISSDLDQRFHEHIKSSKRFPHRKLYKAFSDIGTALFSISLVETVPIDLLNEREQYWISHYDSFQNGYNETIGGISRTQYTYEAIVNDFLDGLTYQQISEKYGCKTYEPIKAALSQADISYRHYSKNSYKYVAYKEKQKVKCFSSEEEIIDWIREHSKTTASDENIIGSVIRVIQGRRKSAYGYQWTREKAEIKLDESSLLDQRGIYGVVDERISEIVYIGSTMTSFWQRWNEHIRNFTRLNYPLYQAFRQYGFEHFHFIVIEYLPSLSQEAVLEREKFWIDFYQTKIKEYGLNVRKPVNNKQSSVSKQRIQQVEQAYLLLDQGHNNSYISSKTGLSNSCISQIRLGKRYVQQDRQYPIVSQEMKQQIDNILELLSFAVAHREQNIYQIAEHFDMTCSKVSNILLGIIPHDILRYTTESTFEKFHFPIEISKLKASESNFPNRRHNKTQRPIYKQSGKKCKVCGKPLTTIQQKYCSYNCRDQAIRQTSVCPPRDDLKRLIRTSNFTLIAQKYNVSDNAVRKWCKAYNLPSTAWEIHQYFDQEWEDECWNNNDNNVPQQRVILYESIIMSLLKSRNGNLALQKFKISKGTMSTARNYYKLPYLPTIQYWSTFCYYQEGQIYFMSAKDAATWLFENQYGTNTNIETLRTKIAASFRSGVPATLTLPDPSTGSSVTLTFTHIPEEEFYSIIQHHHIVSYAFDPKWRTIVEDPSLLPDFVSLDDLPWVEEFKKFYGMD